MKPGILFIAFILSLLVPAGSAQEKSKKQLKEEEEQARILQTEALVSKGDFVFTARWALPMGSGQVDLSTNPNYVRFSKALMDGYMPYFGTATAGIGFSGDPTIKFRAEPETLNIEKKKKSYQVDAKVQGENDVYRLSLNIQFDGTASLTVISNHRGTISYQGAVVPPEAIRYR